MGRHFQIIVHRDGKAELREDVYGSTLVMDLPDEPTPPTRAARTFYEPVKMRRAMFHTVASCPVWTDQERHILALGRTPCDERGEPTFAFHVRILREED